MNKILPLFKKVVVISFFLSLLTPFFSPSIALAVSGDEQFLGLGLGWNEYTKSDIDDLGGPWVYNWGVGDTTGNGKNPQIDFPGKYVPMLYDCSLTGFNSFKAWIELHEYAGYALIFNEPDNTGQTWSSCSNPMSNAVTAIDRVTAWRDTYFALTGNYVDLIFGGTFASPNTTWDPYNNALGGFWFDKFKTAWTAAHPGSSWPNVQGVHFHAYAYVGNTDASSITSAIKADWNASNGWEAYLNAHPEVEGTKDEVWISETGVLNSAVTQSNVNTVMGSVLTYFKGKSRIDRLAWFTHSTNAANRNDRFNTSLVDQSNGSRTSLWTNFDVRCSAYNSGYCSPASPNTIPIDVKDTSISNNLISNVYSSDLFVLDKWYKTIANGNSGAYIQGNGDLAIYSLPVAGGFGSCWIYEMSGAPANGSTYRIRVKYHSSFVNSSFIQLATQTNQNYWAPPYWTLNVPYSSLDSEPYIYDPVGGVLKFKFCSLGNYTPTADYVANLSNISVVKTAGPNIAVKDTTVSGNDITNSVNNNMSCAYGKWCRWYRDGNYALNPTVINATKLRLTVTPTSGNFGSCWIQWIEDGEADGETYNLKASIDTDFDTNITYIGIETATNPNYATFYANGSSALIDQNVYINDAGDPDHIAVKFCTYGTGSDSSRAILKSLSFKQL